MHRIQNLHILSQYLQSHSERTLLGYKKGPRYPSQHSLNYQLRQWMILYQEAFRYSMSHFGQRGQKQQMYG